ncbi:unnamed protein product [Triticum turgidum subsp. durum]|uniref:F-box domain-containing protein n=1 Tax=Triticum turgidum subsp. durum TaxID=4567 RepID=A0A9R1PWS9_TRITD|nr:unnamed protein product [Triticum turgidum subsp. durum]
MDDVLPIVISFLPAHEAVRTCVLSPRWRHFWTSAPGLRITAVGDFGSADKFNQFVDRLLFLRRHSDCPLESCEFDLDDREFGFNSISSFQHVYRWSLQSALDCNVRVLRCSFTDTNPNFRMLPEQLSEYPEPLLSQHLTRLELHCIRCALDFSGCPVLVDLKMEQCVTHAAEMLSPSLRQLSMVCCELSMWHRTQVTLPNLVRLELINCAGCLDDDPCFGCHFHFEFIAQRGSSYFFQGLSRAKHLELLASYNDAFIFQRDLKCRPTFPMLKTLILNDWCLHADLSAVIHFIQHSPNLEKVTLKFAEEFDSSMVTEGDNNLLEGTFSSDHLKMVEIKCLKVDGRINKILKILSACGISLEKVNIRQANTSS